MKYAFLSIIWLLFFLVPSAYSYESKEIVFLLSNIEESNCTFIRNGKEYSGQDASEHLTKKLNYLKSKIKGSEDFIEKVASRSSMSKKPYWVRCQEEKRLTGEWLLEKLADYRMN